MKIILHYLVISILLLSLFQDGNSIGAGKPACCQQTATGKPCGTHKPKKCCESCAFISVGQRSFLPAEKTIMKVIGITVAAIQNGYYLEQSLPEFSASNWHPPKA